MKQDNNISFNISNRIKSNMRHKRKDETRKCFTVKHENAWKELLHCNNTKQARLVCSYCAMSWNLIQIARLISRQMAWSHKCTYYVLCCDAWIVAKRVNKFRSIWHWQRFTEDDRAFPSLMVDPRVEYLGTTNNITAQWAEKRTYYQIQYS